MNFIKKNTHAVLAPFVAFAFSSLPLLAAAQTTLPQDRTLRGLVNLIIFYIQMGLGLLMAFATIAFVYYVIRYFILPNEDRKAAGEYVLYSVIGFFVLLSFWGIVNILQNTFGLQNQMYQPSSWYSFTSLFPRQ